MSLRSPNIAIAFFSWHTMQKQLQIETKTLSVWEQHRNRKQQLNLVKLTLNAMYNNAPWLGLYKTICSKFI